jgi:hypothetical protein
VYTGQIAFATLSSQDVTRSERKAQDGYSQGGREPPQDSEGLRVPPSGVIVVESCSPKSVYCLANKVCLSPPWSDAVANISLA